jgi:hypothetical protein
MDVRPPELPPPGSREIVFLTVTRRLFLLRSNELSPASESVSSGRLIVNCLARSKSNAQVGVSFIFGGGRLAEGTGTVSSSYDYRPIYSPERVPVALGPQDYEVIETTNQFLRVLGPVFPVPRGLGPAWTSTARDEKLGDLVRRYEVLERRASSLRVRVKIFRADETADPENPRVTADLVFRSERAIPLGEIVEHVGRGLERRLRLAAVEGTNPAP